MATVEQHVPGRGNQELLPGKGNQASVPGQGSLPGLENAEFGGFWAPFRDKFLRPLASLKLTVALLFLGIVLVFAGTLAQVNQDIWKVVRLYFRSFYIFIPVSIFLPASFFPGEFSASVRSFLNTGFAGNPITVPFPGGWSIGLAMLINLLAAHMIRFKIQAREGWEWLTGGCVTLLGLLVTYLVVASGSNYGDVLTPSLSYDQIWKLLAGALGFSAIAMWWIGYSTNIEKQRTRYWLITIGSLLGSVSATMFFGGERVQLNDSSIRILWQLAQGTFASLVLLGGCILLFKQRAGIVLLHFGVGILMIHELVVGVLHVEKVMLIFEGYSVQYASDTRSTEIAVIDSISKEKDHVVVIPDRLYRKGADLDTPITHELLPFDLRIDEYFPNAKLAFRKHESDPSTKTGLGQTIYAKAVRESAGTDQDSAVDTPAAYVTLLDRETGEELTSLLLSSELDVAPEIVKVRDKEYEIALRYPRYYNDFQVKLLNVRADEYVGTKTARNFSSEVELIYEDDEKNTITKNVTIWMNNPLRFRGETYYQSQANEETGFTGLQVVSNFGWMLPYVACMIVATGLLFQFLITLNRFLNKQNRTSAQPLITSHPGGIAAIIHWPISILVLVLFGSWLGSKAVIPDSKVTEPDLVRFGRIPVVFQGRVKPLDTVARNLLRALSHLESIKKKTSKDTTVEVPAIKWFLDSIVGNEEATSLRVFRIDSLEVQKFFELEARKGHRYSLDELKTGMLGFEKEVQRISKIPKGSLDLKQKKMLEFARKVTIFREIIGGFIIHLEPAREDIERIPAMLEDQLVLSVPYKNPPPLIGKGTYAWTPLAAANPVDLILSKSSQSPPDPATSYWREMLVAHAGKDVDGFNKNVLKLHKFLREDYAEFVEKELIKRESREGPDLSQVDLTPINFEKLKFEQWFNHATPFYNTSVLYLIAFVLGAIALLFDEKALRWSTNSLLILALVVHTFAIIARIYISGRPPVTNLYSSAVFIGWGCVVLCMILERLYPIGVSTLVAAISGFSTLLIAHFLALEGDTFTVLVAVLDTQFWLATHVVCISLGYSTTFLAGFFGIAYLLIAQIGERRPDQLKKLGKMTYGTLCFALLFSFVGTVLGGLWADDSWGRFWGWDPKENGALIIVLWNALILHARWGAMVKDYGTALLAIMGNICTSWSWFGVNELGVGMHSYGFTEGVLLYLGIFVASQLLLFTAGLILRPRAITSA